MIRKRWDTQDLDQLISHLEKLYLTNSHSYIFFPLAVAYYKANLPQKAEVVLRTGLSFFPKYWGAKALLGKILYEKGDLKESKGHLEAVIKMVPENMIAQKYLIEIYKKTGLNRASEDELRALQIIEKIEGFKDGEIRFIEEENAPVFDKTASVEQRASYPESNMHEAEEFRASAGENVPMDSMDERGKDKQKSSAQHAYIKVVQLNRSKESKKGHLKEPLKAEDDSFKESMPKNEDIIELVGIREKSHAHFNGKSGKEGSDKQEILTATLAELYFKQGLFEKSINIYNKLILQQPDKKDWIERVQEIEKIMAQEQRSVQEEAKTLPKRGLKSKKDGEDKAVDNKVVLDKLNSLLKKAEKLKK